MGSTATFYPGCLVFVGWKLPVGAVAAHLGSIWFNVDVTKQEVNTKNVRNCLHLESTFRSICT